MNREGKTLTIFLGVVSVLMLSLTVITVFFYQQENELRKDLENKYAEAKALEEQLEKEKKDLSKQVFVMEEKAKDVEEKLSSTMDDLDLEKGLREELKKDNEILKEQVDVEKQSNDSLRREIINTQGNIETLKAELEKAQNACTPSEGTASPGLDDVSATIQELNQMVALEQPQGAPHEGHILTINTENNFIVFDLGSGDGIKEGTPMSVFRDNQFLGDVTVSRVQAKMSVADLVSPLNANDLKVNDRVLPKQ